MTALLIIGGLAAGALLWGLMLFLDFALLPFLPGGWWKAPWCFLFGHTDGQDFTITDDGFCDVCTRCGKLTPTDED